MNICIPCSGAAGAISLRQCSLTIARVLLDIRFPRSPVLASLIASHMKCDAVCTAADNGLTGFRVYACEVYLVFAGA